MPPEHVQSFIDTEIAANETDFTDLCTVILNGMLKPSPTTSHTDGPIDVSARVLRGVGTRVNTIRVVDHTIPPGVYSDMRTQGWDVDDLPGPPPRADRASRHRRARHAHLARRPVLDDQTRDRAILRLVRRPDTAGQWPYYGKVGGVLVTGNEGGGKHCAAQMLYASPTSGSPFRPGPMRTGSARPGPGPSYLGDDRGAQNHWTTRNTVFAAWNMLHIARRLKDHRGLPAHGDVTTNWDLGNPTHPDPEYR